MLTFANTFIWVNTVHQGMKLIYHTTPPKGCITKQMLAKHSDQHSDTMKEASEPFCSAITPHTVICEHAADSDNALKGLVGSCCALTFQNILKRYPHRLWVHVMVR